MISDFLGAIGVKAVKKSKVTHKKLIQQEAKIGGKLFGPIPEGHRREFFNLDPKTWVWHEQWQDNGGRLKIMTTRYEVRPNGVMKIQDGQRYTYISGDELDNLASACKLYYQQVTQTMYPEELKALAGAR